MMNSRTIVQSLSSSELLAATRELVHKSLGTEADLVEHLAEIDERRLYLDGPFPSMFAFCVGEYGFSDDEAYKRIAVARAARRLPVILDALRSGRVHMTGLRILGPHLNAENVDDVLAKAAGRSTREIEELVAMLAPKPPVPTVIRKQPAESIPQAPSPTLFDSPAAQTSAETSLAPAPAPAPTPTFAPPRNEQRAVMKPLAEDAYKFQFTGSRACHEKLRYAQALLRHRVPNGDVGAIVERALDLLIAQVTRERFAVGRKPREVSAEEPGSTASRHIPAAIQRIVFERDGGRCTWVDQRGRRCPETADLEFDHVEKMYGRDFMERARGRGRGVSSGDSMPPARGVATLPVLPQTPEMPGLPWLPSG